jgi:hypothetical protein
VYARTEWGTSRDAPYQKIFQTRGHGLISTRPEPAPRAESN